MKNKTQAVVTLFLTFTEYSVGKLFHTFSDINNILYIMLLYIYMCVCVYFIKAHQILV